MVIMNDLEWPMFSYYVISYEKFRKVAVNRERSFNVQWLDNLRWTAMSPQGHATSANFPYYSPYVSNMIWLTA